MAGSLKTAFFNLVKYAANDITSWLTDFNGNMDKIDTALNQNKTAAQTAQDGVDNLESEYATVVQTLANHTNSIESNEKAIAENSASIEELENDVNGIVIGDYYKTAIGASGFSKIENLLEYIALIFRRIGNGIEVKGSLTINSGTLHNYDRVLSGGVFNGHYATDLARISGNPGNLVNNLYAPIILFAYGTSTADRVSTYGVIGYNASDNYTYISLVSEQSSQISYAAKINGVIN